MGALATFVRLFKTCGLFSASDILLINPIFISIFQYTPVNAGTYASRQVFSCICMKRVPCRCFVKKSASMSCAGQNTTFKWPLFLLLVTKYYLTFKWRILFLWVHTCLVPQKWSVYSICSMASAITASSASVELLVFSSCLRNPMHVAPFPSFIYTTDILHVWVHGVWAVYPPIWVVIWFSG